MRGESQVEQLDRYIDALQRGEDPAVDAATDPDLASLCALAREVRRLGEADWPAEDFPERAAGWLANELRPTAAGADAEDEHIEPIPLNGVRDPRATGWALDASDGRRPRHWTRQVLEMVAAVLVVAMVATVVGSILRQRVSVGDQTTPGGQPVITGAQPTATPTPAPSPTAVPLTHDPHLSALQAVAGFDLVAPTWLPDELVLEPVQPPMQLPGFTSVQFTYLDATGMPVLTITQASPYEETRETMPADIYDAAVETDLGDGITARVHEGDRMNQVWWQRGPTTVRLESGPAEDDGRVLATDELLAIARSMEPVPALDPPASLSPDAALPTSDAAVARAREWLAHLDEPLMGEVRLTSMAEPVALGMPEPAGYKPDAPVWYVVFPYAEAPEGCPELGASLCSHGRLGMILDAESGSLIGLHGETGEWQVPTHAPWSPQFDEPTE